MWTIRKFTGFMQHVQVKLCLVKFSPWIRVPLSRRALSSVTTRRIESREWRWSNRGNAAAGPVAPLASVDRGTRTFCWTLPPSPIRWGLGCLNILTSYACQVIEKLNLPWFRKLISFMMQYSSCVISNRANLLNIWLIRWMSSVSFGLDPSLNCIA